MKGILCVNSRCQDGGKNSFFRFPILSTPVKISDKTKIFHFRMRISKKIVTTSTISIEAYEKRGFFSPNPSLLNLGRVKDEEIPSLLARFFLFLGRIKGLE